MVEMSRTDGGEGATDEDGNVTLNATESLTSEQERAVAYRSVFAGHTYADIAEDLDVSAATVGKIVRTFRHYPGEDLELRVLEDFADLEDDRVVSISRGENGILDYEWNRTEDGTLVRQIASDEDGANYEWSRGEDGTPVRREAWDTPPGEWLDVDPQRYEEELSHGDTVRIGYRADTSGNRKSFEARVVGTFETLLKARRSAPHKATVYVENFNGSAVRTRQPEMTEKQRQGALRSVEVLRKPATDGGRDQSEGEDTEDLPPEKDDTGDNVAHYANLLINAGIVRTAQHEDEKRIFALAKGQQLTESITRRMSKMGYGVRSVTHTAAGPYEGLNVVFTRYSV